MTRTAQCLDLPLQRNGQAPIFVHADLLQASAFVSAVSSRAAMLSAHRQNLASVAGGRALWLACFNYDFTRTGHFCANQSICQVGPMGEDFRLQPNVWRTCDPVFSACGIGQPPQDWDGREQITAFDDLSVFGQLYDLDGDILFYGADFSSATIIHHAEWQSRGPVYRYDKDFVGTVRSSRGKERQVTYRYHVRPFGLALEYDWSRLTEGLRSRGILHQQIYRGRVTASCIRARDLVDHWVECLKEDPLYLLDDATREKVIAFRMPLGRRFQIDQFERRSAA